jgi:putative DNA primase/helicase
MNKKTDGAPTRANTQHANGTQPDAEPTVIRWAPTQEDEALFCQLLPHARSFDSIIATTISPLDFKDKTAAKIVDVALSLIENDTRPTPTAIASAARTQIAETDSGAQAEEWENIARIAETDLAKLPAKFKKGTDVGDAAAKVAAKIVGATKIDGEKLRIMPGYATTDTGNAERFIYQHGRKFLYSSELGWMIFDGTRWARDDRSRVASWEKKTVRSIYSETFATDDDAERKALAKWATKSESASSRKAMMENVMKDGPRAIPSDFDADKMLLNVANGTLDLQTGELRPHSQTDRISKICRVTYDRRATCPIFLDSLGMIFNNNDELIRFVQRAIGYSLTGLTREQCFFILHGKGANGKSLLLKIISALMGDYWKHAAASVLMQKRGDAIPNDVAALNGARLVTAIETNEGRKFDEAIAKAMTGDDPITARFFRKEYFTFTPDFKIFLATNHKPQVVGTDDGIWRRIRMLPFNVRFWDADKGESGPAHLRADKTLGERILDNELSGVLNWALEGCMEYLECGLPSPEAVKGATNAYREEMDPVAQFLDECAIKNPALSVLKGELHKAFGTWAKNSDVPAISSLSLSQKMQEKGFAEVRGHGGIRKWAGISLATPDEKDADFQKGANEKRTF